MSLSQVRLSQVTEHLTGPGTASQPSSGVELSAAGVMEAPQAALQIPAVEM